MLLPVEPKVSVVVAAKNAAASMPLLLKALEMQSLDRAMFQVIIVDDGSTDETVALAAACDWVEVIVGKENLGAPIARNVGVKRARGELIAFTDSDCVPDSDWLEHGVAQFSMTPWLDMLGGEIVVGVEQSSSVSAMVDAARYLNQRGSVRMGQGITANLWLRRSTFLSVGGFNERLAKLGYPDTELTAHLSSRGAHLAYDGALRVHHPARGSWADLSRKAYRFGVGHAPYRKYSRARIQYPRLPLFLRPRRLSPRATISQLGRLEECGIRITRRRRAQMLAVELMCVSVPMFFGDLFGTLRSVLRSDWRPSKDRA